uniref:CARMIL C-terminal domain-containing protein n=1 Tax=Iconisemion striatum TaxID=60296 RepID=A0A1A7X6W9_9TELE
MELPLGGPALRHYTQSRPRPHRQKLNYRPSRPQETIIESENEVLELMGRVDEGVEEFFTKKVLPTETQSKQDEECITLQEVAPASSVPCPPPTKTLRRKLGDFFTLKKKRGLKSEPSQEGRPKKASIADLIRPLREVARSEKDKDKDRVKEHDKENEKEKAKGRPSVGESADQETPVTGDAPLRGEAAPPRRALREGKSQSLILLSGSAAAGTTNTRHTAKKPLEGQHSFEQKLHLMLQRIGVSKPQPGETQNQEGEMKKAESEGTIIDSKPEPPSTFSKPRTMSASSDTRHQIRASVSAHEAAGKPALPPKPVIKSGPPPTTSGRNTPENELTQIQEAETNTPTKLSPTIAPSVPSAPDPTTTPTSSVQTISNSVPDSAIITVSSSITVSPSDTEICSDSINPTEAAATPTDGTVSEPKASIPNTSTPSTEPPASTLLTALTSTTTPTEPLTSASALPASSESITPASETPTTSSIVAPEPPVRPSNQSSVPTTSTAQPAMVTSTEPDGSLSTDASPATGGDEDVSVTTTASSSEPVLHATISSDTEAGETRPTSAMLVSKTTSDSNGIAAVSHDVPVTMSSSVVPSVLPPTSSSSSTDETINPTSSDHMSSAPCNIQPATLIPADVSAPSTSSSDTNPTDTTSTATSSNRADVTSTSSSAHTAAISSPHITGSDPIPAVPPIDDDSSGSSHHLTSQAPSNGSLCPDSDLQTSCEDGAREEKAEDSTKKDIAVDEELEMTDKSAKLDVKNGVVSSEKQSKSDNDKPAPDNSNGTGKEVQEESVKAADEAPPEPALGKECEQSGDDAVTMAQEQEEALPMGEK